MRFVLFFLLFFTFAAAHAAEEAKPPVRDVPVISYAQKVNIVVAAKKNPAVFDLRIDQDKDNVMLSAIVDNSIDRKAAEELARNLVVLTKSMTLDDKPTDIKVPGKGLYNYGVRVARVDAVVLASARKPANKKKLVIEPQALENLQFQPLTRAGGTR